MKLKVRQRITHVGFTYQPGTYDLPEELVAELRQRFQGGELAKQAGRPPIIIPPAECEPAPPPRRRKAAPKEAR